MIVILIAYVSLWFIAAVGLMIICESTQADYNPLVIFALCAFWPLAVLAFVAQCVAKAIVKIFF
jgi:hypothetical protein